MNIEEIFQECLKRYPIGTVYKCTMSPGIERTYKVETQTFSIHNSVTIYGENSKGVLYAKGKWAPITESAIDLEKILTNLDIHINQMEQRLNQSGHG